MKRFKFLIIVLNVFLFPCFDTWAQSRLAPIPPPQGWVNDYAQLISSQNKQQIENWAEELEKKTTAQIAVVTLKTVQPETIETYSVRLFDQWKIGQKGKDNGVLLVVAVYDHEAWITTGYGLEGTLPDAICSQIVNRDMIPYFKDYNYSEGIKKGVQAIVSLIAKEYGVQITGQENEVSESLNTAGSSNYDSLSFIFIFIFIILTLFMRIFWLGGFGGYGYYSGSLGGRGGFGGFGGGMTGGGGAGGRW